MPKMTKARLAALLIALVLAATALVPAQAGDTVLNVNRDSGNTVWFISGERSLVMNGFDLTPLGLTFPVAVDRVSISVVTPQPGSPVDVVIYQDANGGSPVDATLLRQERIDITTSGTFTYTFDNLVGVTEPVLWIGFYLPVDFEFRADTSGSSVLTYWGWTPNSTFDLTDLSSATVFGPADGSAPVNIDMNGIARITAELDTGGQDVNVTSTPAPSGAVTSNLPSFYDLDDDEPIRQINGGTVDYSPISGYQRGTADSCANLGYDQVDVSNAYNNNIRMYCRLDNVNFSPETPEGYTWRGPLYNVTAFGVNSAGTDGLPFPITHCMVPSASDLNTAVIGLGYGAPREWVIVPTVRYGDGICAEMTHTGYISYFVPN